MQEGGRGTVTHVGKGQRSESVTQWALERECEWAVKNEAKEHSVPKESVVPKNRQYFDDSCTQRFTIRYEVEVEK